MAELAPAPCLPTPPNPVQGHAAGRAAGGGPGAGARPPACGHQLEGTAARSAWTVVPAGLCPLAACWLCAAAASLFCHPLACWPAFDAMLSSRLLTWRCTPFQCSRSRARGGALPHQRQRAAGGAQRDAGERRVSRRWGAEGGEGWQALGNPCASNRALSCSLTLRAACTACLACQP